MMKKFLLQFCFVSLGFVTVNCQSRSTTSKPTDASVGLESNSCPISLNTTTITYSHHTNSGIAIYTTIKIYEDHLVWEYDEDASVWIKRVGFIAPEDINDDNLRILVHKPTENADPHFPFHVPAFDFAGYSVKLVDPNKLHIISVYDLFESMPEKNNNIIVSLQNT